MAQSCRGACVAVVVHRATSACGDIRYPKYNVHVCYSSTVTVLMYIASVHNTVLCATAKGPVLVS